VFEEGCRREHLPECSFRPLLIGVTWASDWEISPWLALPPALVRAVSFPDKANDAEEIGITWLRALVQYVVLPVRNGADGGGPRVIMMGHSFGGRATMAALSEDTGLRKPRPQVLASMESEDKVDQFAPVDEFRPGDRFISLEGAYKIARLFQNEVPTKLQPIFTRNGLHANLIASEFDTAVNSAIWGNYAGAVSGYNALCGTSAAPEIVAAVDCRAIAVDKKGRFGRAECATPTRQAPSRGSGSAPVLYIDASSVVNCNAAFTGGGSHSDIYRREMSRLLWDLIVNDAREVERSAYNSTIQPNEQVDEGQRQAHAHDLAASGRLVGRGDRSAQAAP
jgi:hypothetical protein